MLGLFDVAVLPLTVPIDEHNFTLKCVATPLPRLTQILPYLTLEWIKSSTTEVQKYFTENTTRALQFSPLTVSHGGIYTCRARLNIPNSVGHYITMKSFNLVVRSKSIT